MFGPQFAVRSAGVCACRCAAALAPVLLRGMPPPLLQKQQAALRASVCKPHGSRLTAAKPAPSAARAEARLHRGTVAMVRDDAGGGVRSQFFIACMPMTTQLSKQMGEGGAHAGRRACVRVWHAERARALIIIIIT